MSTASQVNMSFHASVKNALHAPEIILTYQGVQIALSRYGDDALYWSDRGDGWAPRVCTPYYHHKRSYEIEQIMNTIDGPACIADWVVRAHNAGEILKMP